MFFSLRLLAPCVLVSFSAVSSASAAETVPVLEGLGDHHYTITTTNDRAQIYFNQGLRLYYAFNHFEAVRAFQEAQRLDPSCAMCFWGEALALGPNINMAMPQQSAFAAYAAVQRAISLLDDESTSEQALVHALAIRYAEDAPADRAALDRSYADAIGELANRYPDDDEIQTLHGESLMNLRPWDYWTESGAPKQGISEALARLETVVARSPSHPGACHFFIHAVEKIYPQRAVECADRLANLMPGAGHLVHMPGHIYIRVGRYDDAIIANEHAVHADESYIQDQQPGAGMYTAGYYPHNYDFLVFAALMIGRGSQAVDAATKVATLVPDEMLGSPGMDFLQHWVTRPLQIMVRTRAWDDIIATPAPSLELPHASAMWHYARGRALAATGRTAAAHMELKHLTAVADSNALEGLMMQFNKSSDIIAVARHVLAGRVAEAEGQYSKAVEQLELAVTREDAMLYGEPPEWSVPVRQELGEVLLAAQQHKRAAEIFREDLQRFPDNGWSLHGLAQAEGVLGNSDSAAALFTKFREVWEKADIEL